ncbi:MAG: hypothetical protein AAFP19_11480 [Bacteroidota bacterium]
MAETTLEIHYGGEPGSVPSMESIQIEINLTNGIYSDYVLNDFIPNPNGGSENFNQFEKKISYFGNMIGFSSLIVVDYTGSTVIGEIVADQPLPYPVTLNVYRLPKTVTLPAGQTKIGFNLPGLPTDGDRPHTG